MINKSALFAMGLGLVVATTFVGLILLKQRGATPSLVGEITAVRTLGMDEASSVAIVDFRFTNSSRFNFIVATCDMSVADAKGEIHQGQIVAAGKAGELFELFPALGLKQGETLIIRTKILPREPRLAMLAARFEIPKADLDARRKITVAITDLDGAVSEISQ